MKRVLLLWFITNALFQTLDAQMRYELEVRTALSHIFGNEIEMVATTLFLSEAEQESIKITAKQKWTTDSFTVYKCWNKSTLLGYGIVDNVKGKSQMITYLVVVDSQFAVKEIEILRFREPYGGEVAFASFRKQFRGKDAQSSLTVGKEIKKH